MKKKTFTMLSVMIFVLALVCLYVGIERFMKILQAEGEAVKRRVLSMKKERKEFLRLGVYQKNERAVQFYKREGFQIESENVDEDMGEKEYVMAWK